MNQDPEFFLSSYRESECLLGQQGETQNGAVLKSSEKSLLCLVDSVFGTGFKRRIACSKGEQFLKHIKPFVKTSKIIAVDLPSGLEANQIQVSAGERDSILEADLTLSYGGLKPSLLLSPARGFAGRIKLAAIDFPQEAREAAAAQFPVKIYEASSLARKRCPIEIKREQADIHKFDRGLVLILGGEVGKEGAAVLAATAALKVGCGWVAISSPPSRSSLFNLRPNLPLEVTYENIFSKAKINDKFLSHWIEQRRPKAILIGCGLTKNPFTKKTIYILREFAQSGGRVIFDAGAIPGLAGFLDKPCLEKQNLANFLALPHPGEWLKAFVGLPLPKRIEDFETISSFLKTNQLALALKTATPICFSGDRTPSVSICGSNFLARAGTGDILAGICAGLTSEDSDLQHIFVRAYYILAEAANYLRSDGRNMGHTTTDILNSIGRGI